MKKVLFTFLIWQTWSVCFAQTKTVRILDSNDKSPISGVNIYLESGELLTSTNIKGYGQFELGLPSPLITIQHPTYVTSQVQTPEQSFFSILVDRAFTELPKLNLTKLTADSLSNFRSWFLWDSLNVENNFQNAQYLAGWNEFYLDLAKNILIHPEAGSSNFDVNYRFCIDATGKIISAPFIGDTVYIAEKLNDIISQFDGWKPASYQGNVVKQYFSIHMLNSEREEVKIELPKPKDKPAIFEKNLRDNLIYPEEAIANNIKGNVKLSVVVSAEGTLKSIEILEALGFGCDEEAIRLIRKNSSWVPGKRNGIPVEMKTIVNVPFIPSIDSDIRESIYKYLLYNIPYPSNAKRNGKEGIIRVEFEISKPDMKIRNVKALNDFTGDFKNTMMSVLSNMPLNHITDLSISGTKFILPVSLGLAKAYKTKVELDPDQAVLMRTVEIVSINEKQIELPAEADFTPAEYPGGYDEYKNYLLENNNLAQQLPSPNKFNNQVLLEFEVDESGSINNVQILEGLDEKFDQIAADLISKMPNWIPGRRSDSLVRTKVKRYVTFGMDPKLKYSTAMTNYKRGMDGFVEKDFEKSLFYLTRAIEMNTSDLNFYFNRARSLVELDRIDEACEDLSLILSKDKESAQLYDLYCSN